MQLMCNLCEYFQLGSICGHVQRENLIVFQIQGYSACYGYRIRWNV